MKEFYDSIDIVATPLEFSTGIKIKVAEALAWQKPVISTHNGFEGFRSFHATQSLPSVEAACDALVGVAFGEIPFDALQVAARRAAAAAADNNKRGFSQLAEMIQTRLKRIIFCTDRQFWHRRSFIDEAIAQAIEFFSHLCKVVVFFVGSEIFQRENIYADVEFINLTNDSEDEVRQAFSFFNTRLVVCSVADVECARLVNDAAQEAGIDQWDFDIHLPANGLWPEFSFVNLALDQKEAINVTPIRYTPLVTNRKGLDFETLFVITDPDASEWDQLARSYLTQIAGELGLNIIELKDDENGHDNERLFKDLMLNAHHPTVFIGRPTVSWRFCRQVLSYLKNRWLWLSEGQIVPVSIGDDGLPSLEGSIRSFLNFGEMPWLDRHASDAGWDIMWRRYSS